MRDGRTRKISQPEPPGAEAAFFARWRVCLVSLAGATAGNEYPLERASQTLGRGAEADLRFDDEAMSREHAAFELSGDGLRVRDLGSTNGVQVNGTETLLADLKHGDKVQVGEHQFQLVLEERAQGPATYVLDEG